MSDASKDDRPVKPAMLDGFRLRCPNCQGGKLFTGYLKPVDQCAYCGEDFKPQRADDGPAYIVILLVGHIIGLALHLLFETLDRDPVKLLAVFIVHDAT